MNAFNRGIICSQCGKMHGIADVCHAGLLAQLQPVSAEQYTCRHVQPSELAPALFSSANTSQIIPAQHRSPSRFLYFPLSSAAQVSSYCTVALSRVTFLQAIQESKGSPNPNLLAAFLLAMSNRALALQLLVAASLLGLRHEKLRLLPKTSIYMQPGLQLRRLGSRYAIQLHRHSWQVLLTRSVRLW